MSHARIDSILIRSVVLLLLVCSLVLFPDTPSTPAYGIGTVDPVSTGNQAEPPHIFPETQLALLPALSLSTSFGTPGTAVEFSGTGFTSAGRVGVFFTNGATVQVAQVSANITGTITGTLSAPNPATVSGLSFGTGTVFAVDQSTSTQTLPVAFLLLAPIAPTAPALSPTSGPPGAVVQFTATGFTPGGSVVIDVTSVITTQVAQVAADASGAITGTFSVPNPAAISGLNFGPVNVFAIDQVSGKQGPASQFTITSPSPAGTSVFFAEGSTQAPFQTWFLIQNPGSAVLNVTFTFELQGGGTVQNAFGIGPTSRFSLFANEILPNQAFSTRIDGDQPFFAERSMFVSFEGDDVTQISAPATIWLFAEGATVQPFHTWLLLQNPNAQTATATITYLVQGGATQTQILGLPPTSRTSVFVNEVLPNVSFSTQVKSDLPIIVERAEYRFPGNAAMADAGVQNPSATWYFAEGSTVVNPFGLTLPEDTWLLIQNPNNGPVSVAITLFDTQGRSFATTQFIPPLTRVSFFLNQFTNLQSFGIQINASSPVVVERSNFFNIEPKGAMLTFGTPALKTIWNFPEGSTASPFEEVISVLNPNDQNMSVSMKFFLQGGQTVIQQFVVPPKTKLSVTVDSIILNAANSAQIVSSLPCVAERTMFFNKPGGIGGSNKVGIPGAQ